MKSFALSLRLLGKNLITIEVATTERTKIKPSAFENATRLYTTGEVDTLTSNVRPPTDPRA